MSTPVPRSRLKARLLLALTLALTASAALASTGCPKTKKHKTIKDDGPKGPTVDQVLTEARAAVAGGDIDGANAKYMAAYKIKADFAILDERVAMLIDNKRPDAAVAAAQEYYDNNPTDARGGHLYANALIALGNFTEALAVVDELLALDENDAAAHEKKGRALILGKQVEPGIEELQRAVTLEPKNGKFMIELGSGLLTANRIGEAALQLRAAILIEPDDARALMLLGLALSAQTELQEAEVFLRQSTKLTKDARPWFELGYVQSKRGDLFGAEESLAQAVAMEPTNELYQYAYGEVLRYQGDSEKDPDAKQEKYEAAIAAYRIAADHDPPHYKAAAKLGLTLALAKRSGEAEVYLTDAIRKDPDNQYNYFNLGAVFNDEGKLKQAKEMFQTFLKLADKEDGDRPRATDCVKLLSAKHNKKKCSL